MKFETTTKARNFDRNSNEVMWKIKLEQVKGIRKAKTWKKNIVSRKALLKQPIELTQEEFSIYLNVKNKLKKKKRKTLTSIHTDIVIKRSKYTQKHGACLP